MGFGWESVVANRARVFMKYWWWCKSKLGLIHLLCYFINAISWFCIVFHLCKIIRLSNNCKMLLYFIILPSAVKHGHLSTITNREVVHRRTFSFRVSLYSISNESIRGVHKQPLEPITLTYVPTTLLRLKWSIKLCFFVPLYLLTLCLLSLSIPPSPTITFILKLNCY